MKRIMCLISLLLFFFFLSHGGVSATNNNTKYSHVSSRLTLELIHKHLEKINKPAVLTIQGGPDGDIMDCVHIEKQLALDHPLLKNHKIQRSPSAIPTIRNKSSNEIPRWNLNRTTSCPTDTIPVRRTTVNDLLGAKTLSNFEKKPSGARSIIAASVSDGHEYAVGSVKQDVFGAKAYVSVWDPTIMDGEFSLSQLWVVAGDAPNQNTLEAGWTVNQDINGDKLVRLFTYWTADSYRATGCYNTKCPGFVQVSKNLSPGEAIAPVSVAGAAPVEISISIFKDPKSGNWWLALNDDNAVGYWPSELFPALAEHATLVEFGGEVVNRRAGGKHTTTQMGSGQFPKEGLGKASYFRNLATINFDNNVVPVQNLDIQVTNPTCYDLQKFLNNQWGTHFYYGGPGNNPNCP